MKIASHVEIHVRGKIDNLAFAPGPSFKCKEGELAEMSLTMFFAKGDHGHKGNSKQSRCLAILKWDRTQMPTGESWSCTSWGLSEPAGLSLSVPVLTRVAESITKRPGGASQRSSTSADQQAQQENCFLKIVCSYCSGKCS